MHVGVPVASSSLNSVSSTTPPGPGCKADAASAGHARRTMFEEAMAELEGADRALAFTSGMAALAAVTKLVVMGEHIVAGDDIYGGTSRLLAQVGCS